LREDLNRLDLEAVREDLGKEERQDQMREEEEDGR